MRVSSAVTSGEPRSDFRECVELFAQEEASFRSVCYYVLGALHVSTCIIKDLLFLNFFFPTAIVIAILYFCKVLAEEHDFPILYPRALRHFAGIH